MAHLSFVYSARTIREKHVPKRVRSEAFSLSMENILRQLDYVRKGSVRLNLVTTQAGTKTRSKMDLKVNENISLPQDKMWPS